LSSIRASMILVKVWRSMGSDPVSVRMANAR
jgi:hypothetical protein